MNVHGVLLMSGLPVFLEVGALRFLVSFVF